MNNNFVVRFATLDDVPFIAEIYNDAILKTTATFDTEIKSNEDRAAWLLSHQQNKRTPVFVR